MMKIKRVRNNKKAYLPLLLLGDEQESMIDKYLDKGEMYLATDPEPVAQCVVLDVGNGVFEIKNLSVITERQGQGIGSYMLNFIADIYRDRGQELILGTGENPATLAFYCKNGFVAYDRVKNFFTDNYDHPIFENGIQLVDMIYLKRRL